MEYKHPPRVGIIGGGQLARMLCEAGAKLGLSPVVYTETPEVVKEVSSKIVLGRLDDLVTLRTFLACVEIVVFENEFVDCSVLLKASEGLRVRFVPELSVMKIFQDKVEQKKFLFRLGIPTATWSEKLPDEIPSHFLQRSLDQFGGSAVLKWAKLGYDGKGIFFVDPTNLGEADRFVREGDSKNARLFSERYVSCVRELAMVACRSSRGELFQYPLVVSEQMRGVCDRVFGPAVRMGVSETLEPKACGYSDLISKECDLFGTFAIELFESKEGELIVNEIAPRVHNTGHYSLNWGGASQFENHWRGVLGLPLGRERGTGFFVMQNLLGPDGIKVDLDSFAFNPDLGNRISLYWYGKSSARPFRKLGHMNATFEAMADFQAIVKQLKMLKENWEKTLKKQDDFSKQPTEDPSE